MSYTTELVCSECLEGCGDDPHFPHEPTCTGPMDVTCQCWRVTCDRCCAECAAIHDGGGGGPRQTGTTAPTGGVTTQATRRPALSLPAAVVARGAVWS